MLCIRDLANPHFGPIELDVAGGECIAVHGPSGAGKSVFLRAIVDLDPNQGTVSWRGQQRAEMTAPDWRRLVAYVPAETGWWADLVAGHFECDNLVPDTIDLGAQFESVGLPAGAVNWDVARLSTGERHRLGLLRAFIRKPQVLLLDEPTASLDAAATAKVEQVLHQHLARGAAILLVTHDLAQAERLTARTFEMASGRLAPSRADAVPGSGLEQ